MNKFVCWVSLKRSWGNLTVGFTANEPLVKVAVAMIQWKCLTGMLK